MSRYENTKINNSRKLCRKKLIDICCIRGWCTSDPSKDYKSFLESLATLDGEGSNIHRLLTAAVGISAEGGEFMEIVKKMVFQGKPWNHDNREHLIIELGDVMWYVMQACAALNVTLDEVIEGNVEKLKKRYPGGDFDVHKSENRAANDR